MLRAILVFFATSMLTVGISTWLGRVGGGLRPQVATVDDVISGRVDDFDTVTLKNVTLEFERAVPEPADPWEKLVPIAGTSGRLAVRLYGSTQHPPRTLTLSGMVRRYTPPAKGASAGLPAYTMTYLDVNWVRERQKAAVPWLIAAGLALLWAAWVQLRVWMRRPPAAVTLPESDKGEQCTVCSTKAGAAPCRLRVRTARVASDDKAVAECRKAGLETPIRLCPDCRARLWRVGIRRPVLLLVLWILCIAYPLMGMRSDNLWSALAGTPIVLAGVYLAANYWLNSRYETALGGVFSDQLKAKFGIDSWTLVERVRVWSPGT